MYGLYRMIFTYSYSVVYIYICVILPYVCIVYRLYMYFYAVEEYARTFMLRYSLLLSYKSTKKKLSSHMMRRNVLYVCIRIPTHCKHIIPAGRKQESTWSNNNNNNKITPEYISRVYIFQPCVSSL